MSNYLCTWAKPSTLVVAVGIVIMTVCLLSTYTHEIIYRKYVGLNMTNFLKQILNFIGTFNLQAAYLLFLLPSPSGYARIARSNTVRQFATYSSCTIGL
jgi:hypothetical protein